jgi:hypothetical protein
MRNKITNDTPRVSVRLRPNSATVLALCGLALLGIGLYFMLVRPAFLPEDARYAGASLKELQAVAPNISQWLRWVFWVLGGYITATGILTIYFAKTAFRARARGAGGVAVLAGITSVGLMAAVNIIIHSDFELPLVGLAALWTLALALYGRER